MNKARRPRTRILLFVLLPLVLPSTVVRAQDTAASPAAPAATKKADADKKPAAPTDPWVRAIIAAPITNPTERLQAVFSLVHLKQPELAKKYLKQLIDAKLDAQVLAGLQQRFGSAVFVSLSINPALQPEGKTLARAVMDARAQLGHDPKRLAQLVTQLGATDRGQRARAMRALLGAGPTGAVAMLPALKKPANDIQRAALYETLKGLGRDAFGPLTAALESPDKDLRVAVIHMLGRLKSTSAVPDLLPFSLAPKQDPVTQKVAADALRKILGEVPASDEAEQFLKQRLDNFLAGSPPSQVNDDNQVSVWSWHQPTGRVVRSVVDVADGTLDAVVRTARELHQIAPADKSIEQLYLVAVLEQQQRRVGYDNPIAKPSSGALATVWKAHPEQLVALLQEARHRHFPGAAIVVLQRLAKTGDVSLLRGTDGRPSPVVATLLDPDRRVRFNAARAIVAFDPKQPYAGSSYLTDVLGYLATSAGKSRALIGHPKTVIGRRLAAQMTALGFAADIASTGRQLVLEALRDPDYALILIDDAISHPPQSELVQILRRDPRTGELPIGLIVRDLENYSARTVVASDPRTLVFAMPGAQADMAFELRRLLEIDGRQWLAPEQRVAQALFALNTLIHWAENPSQYGFYDILSQQSRIINAFNAEHLASRTARLLGLLATPEAQTALVEFGSEAVRPLAARQAAVAAFKRAVQRRHLLLKRQQVQTQYDRYNASANLDHETQQILAGILDAMEMPLRKKEQKK